MHILCVIRAIFDFSFNLFLIGLADGLPRVLIRVSDVIQTLRPCERIKLDRNRLAEIVARLGPHGADELISRTMEELAVLLAKVHKSLRRDDPSSAGRSARKIAEVAAHVGMPLLSKVASDVVVLAGINDGAALAATVARLSRIGEDSLMKVWDLQDLKM